MARRSKNQDDLDFKFSLDKSIAGDDSEEVPKCCTLFIQPARRKRKMIRLRSTNVAALHVIKYTIPTQLSTTTVRKPIAASSQRTP